MAQTSHPASKTNERSRWVRMRATGNTSTRVSEVECKTILAETWLMEVERRMRFLVIENSMTRNAISASTFPGHPRCNSTPSCWVSMLRGVRFCSSLHLLSELAAWGSMRHLKIRSLQEAENPAIPRLLAQAWADGLKRVEQLHHRSA